MATYSELEQSLLTTLAFFDGFDYPLSLLELHRWRWAPRSTDESSLADCLAALAHLPVEQRDGYWCLAGRQNIIISRHERYRLAENKFQSARRLARVLGLLPWVRLVAVCNSLAWSNAGAASDIDLFIVCRPRTLWLTRLLVVGGLTLTGLRPDDHGGANRFCLSFFASEDALDLAELQLPGEDPYLVYWLASLVPLYDAGGVFARLYAANSWLKSHLPSLRPQTYGKRRVISGHDKSSISASRLTRWLDGRAERWQRHRLPKKIIEMMNRDSRVVVSDDWLKFHTNDRRAEYRDAWQKKATALNLHI